MSRNNTRTFDLNLRMKDSYAVAADAAAQVASVDKILDIGSGYVEGLVQIDVTAIDITTGDEFYNLRLQLSNSSSFAATVVTSVILPLGDSTVTGGSADTGLGRFELHFSNEFQGTLYRYARMYTDVGGTTPSITYTANMYMKK